MIQSRIKAHNKRHNKAVALIGKKSRFSKSERQLLGVILCEWSIHERRAIMAGRRSRRDARTFAEVPQ